MDISPNTIVEVIASGVFGFLIMGTLLSIATTLKGGKEKSFVVSAAVANGLIFSLGISPEGILYRNLVQLSFLPPGTTNFARMVLMIAAVLEFAVFPYKMVKGGNTIGVVVFFIATLSGALIGSGIIINSKYTGIGLFLLAICIATSLFVEDEMISWGR